MIRNLRSGKVLAHEKILCTNTFTRARGLMFHLPLKDAGMIFTFNRDVLAAIHMLFVFFPIDILWLNEQQEVVQVKERILPFTPHVSPRVKSRFFIELPAGTIQKTKTKEGDRISF
jgi:uncharacterized membrane protein (UPF0127 family)